ncbi:hypothetical protein FRC07_009346 [Ceratobasidium sp. 392]|nr:hypothetical protein FRC07_009346 [Ceratobasidium sp. 392]
MFLFDAIQKRADGALHMNLPFPTDSPIPSLAASDVGGFVLAAFLDPSRWVGQDMRLCTEYITPRQYATIFEEVSGIPVRVHEVTLDEFMQMEGNPYPSDVWSIFRWFLEGPATAPFNPETAARIFPERQTWRQFALQHVRPTVPSPSTVEIKQEYMVQTDGGIA